jgi:uncharacterized Zn-binding protein involved in type VI secretion
MGKPAAKANDRVVGVDTHIVMVPSPGGPVPTPLPHPFSAMINGGTISSVKIGGQAAAVVGSTADNSPAHIPTPPGTSFQKPPANKATIQTGSGTVKIGGKMAARMGDTANNCNDPADAPTGSVIAAGMVLIGG